MATALAQDAATPPDTLGLDMSVYSASRTLSHALVYRLTAHVRALLPEARTIRTAFNEYSGRNEAWEICGPHGKVLYSQEQQGDLYKIDTGYLHASTIASDVDMVVALMPTGAKGWPWVTRLTGQREWSIRLQEGA